MTAVRGVDYIYHAAALKQVPSCEFYPLEAVKTNIIGTENVLEVAINESVSRVVCLSTDKAVYPINAMGISKAMMEKVVIAKSRNSRNTTISITRYGNVMASRGSVIPLFYEQICQGKSLTVTDPEMTRFIMSLDEAVDLVSYAFEAGGNGDIFVQKSPAATIETLALALIEIYGKSGHPIDNIGPPARGKIIRGFAESRGMLVAEDLGKYFKVSPDLRDMNYGKYVDCGDKRLGYSEQYTSHNTRRLNVKEMMELLGKANLDELNR